MGLLYLYLYLLLYLLNIVIGHHQSGSMSDFFFDISAHFAENTIFFSYNKTGNRSIT